MFRKSAQKNQVSLKSDEYSEYFTCLYLAQFLLEWEMFHTQYAQKTETRVLCSKLFFFRKSCRLPDAKKMAQPNKTHVTRGRMRSTCWITKPTDMYDFCFWTSTAVRKMRLNITLTSTVRVLLFSLKPKKRTFHINKRFKVKWAATSQTGLLRCDMKQFGRWVQRFRCNLSTKLYGVAYQNTVTTIHKKCFKLRVDLRDSVN
jgi:hypothetical protein